VSVMPVVRVVHCGACDALVLVVHLVHLVLVKPYAVEACAACSTCGAELRGAGDAKHSRHIYRGYSMPSVKELCGRTYKNAYIICNPEATICQRNYVRR
jgi:hypothetical protein